MGFFSCETITYLYEVTAGCLTVFAVSAVTLNISEGGHAEYSGARATMVSLL